MTRAVVSFALALVVAAVLSPPAQRAAEQTRRVEDEILKLEREWLQAEERGDVVALNRIFADDFVGMSFDGNILGKQDVIPQENLGQSRMPKSSLKEATVRVFGDTGVVMGRVAIEDPEQPREFRFTTVFLKRGSNWQAVAAHLSR